MNGQNQEAVFHVEQIDHVELCVPDRKIASSWYRDILGLEVIPEFAHWAEDPRGPLMIGTRQGSTKLALFEHSLRVAWRVLKDRLVFTWSRFGSALLPLLNSSPGCAG